MPHANNKGADQPAHLRSLISTFAVRCLDSIIPLVSSHEISSFVCHLVGNPEYRFSRDKARLLTTNPAIINKRERNTNKTALGKTE